MAQIFNNFEILISYIAISHLFHFISFFLIIILFAQNFDIFNNFEISYILITILIEN